jgi:hypothetical protein
MSHVADGYASAKSSLTLAIDEHAKLANNNQGRTRVQGMAWIEPQTYSIDPHQRGASTVVSWFVTTKPWIFRQADELRREFRRLGRFGERWQARLAELARAYAQIQPDLEPRGDNLPPRRTTGA